MRHAIELAARGKNTVSPNPAVGCVIVKNEQIIAESWHQAAGQAHAEVMALAQAGTQARGATLYLTLEPCCHYGRTPPCINHVMNSGIKKIYIASIDPNPKVNGKSIARLEQSGIEVEVGLCDSDNKHLNRDYFYYHRHQRPWVIAKWAMSLDGSMQVNHHDDRQISSLESQIKVHQLRNRVDALVIGAGTAITDNPRLSVRLADVHPIRQPQAIILSRHGKLPLDLTLLQPDSPVKTTVVTTTDVDKTWRKIVEKNGVEVLTLTTTAASDHPILKQQIDLNALLQILAKRGMTSILVEGGKRTHHCFFAANLINECQCYLAPVIIGPWQQKKKLARIDCELIGKDWHYTTLLSKEYC